MKSVALHTLGCKLNFTETSTVGRQFLDHGFGVVEFDQPADVYVLNTCSVTERADRECRQLIRRALRTRPDAYVVVMGCYAQLQPEEVGGIEGVDLVLGTKEKFNVFGLAGNFTKKGVPQVFVSCIDESIRFDEAFSSEVGGRTRAFLKVQDGCDFGCSFCTIPLARGATRSQPVQAVLAQAETIVRHGYREIVLTGVNVGDYGKKSRSSLLQLMMELEKVSGLDRVRISSIEPNLVTDDMVEFVLGSEKFCNHFHLPLQSGSDTILRSMRRRYGSGHYRRLVEYIKGRDPDTAIGVDVITGFPGETEKLFEETCSFLSDLPISYLHVFTYSERSNTPAAHFPGSVEPRFRFKRNEVLRHLSRKKRRAFHSSFVGKALPVLFESRSNGESMSGLTRNYIRVEAQSKHALVNEIHAVKIEEIDDNVCRGYLISSESHHSAQSVGQPYPMGSFAAKDSLTHLSAHSTL